MLDISDKTEALIAKLRAGLPVRARPTPEVLETLCRGEPELDLPRHCDITDIGYAGDEGGIMCTLDFGLDDRKNVCVVSITHLRFDPNSRMAREVIAYQRRRVKKLNKLRSRPF